MWAIVSYNVIRCPVSGKVSGNELCNLSERGWGLLAVAAEQSIVSLSAARSGELLAAVG